METTTFIFDNKTINLDGTTFYPDEILKEWLREKNQSEKIDDYKFFSVNLFFERWEPKFIISFYNDNEGFTVNKYPLWEGFLLKIDNNGIRVFYAHYTLKINYTPEGRIVRYSEGLYHENIDDYFKTDFLIKEKRVFYAKKEYSLQNFETVFNSLHQNNFKFVLYQLGIEI